MAKRGRPAARGEWPDISAMTDVEFVSHLANTCYLAQAHRERYQKRIDKICDSTREEAARLFARISVRRYPPDGTIL